MKTEEIFTEIEFSLSLLEPLAFKVKPIGLSLRKGCFSGIWAKYRDVDVFIPHNELKRPYFLRSAAEELVRNRATIKVYPLRIEENRQGCSLGEWQTPIFTMFSPADRATAMIEAEEIKSIGSETMEINIKEETIIEGKDFKLQVVGVEYHQNKSGKRPKSVIFRITAPSKYPIIRQDQEQADFEKWEKMSEHSERKSSKSIRRFFYKKRGINSFKVGEVKITLFPFFSEKEGKELRAEGYVGKLRIFIPRPQI